MKRKLLIFIICTFCNTVFATGIGYALSGGGARGFAHIGVLKVLEEEGLKPDYISGTSIGAVIGAFYAMGYNASQIESLAINIDWYRLLQDNVPRRDLYVGQKRWAPYGNTILELDEKWNPKLPTSLYKANNLNLELFELYAPASGIRDFNKLDIPFSCIATDLQKGTGKEFVNGSLWQAVRASLSVPSLILPFKVGESLYIDGGISQNLPIAEVKQMGAGLVLAIKVNSSLREEENLESIIDILDQTINIGISRNLQKNLDQCDLLLEPELSPYSSQDFKHVDQIIAIGEDYARKNIDQIRLFIQSNNIEPRSIPRYNQHEEPIFQVNKLEGSGNERISLAKIREYLGIKIPGRYNAEEISTAARRALNSQYFNVLYPELIPDDKGGYILRIIVNEKQAKSLTLNTAYNNEEKLTAGVVLNINNKLLKNSRLLAQAVLGGKNELNIDYVKNFGDLWGIYYRLFSYINEKTLYAYNEDHYQVNSSKSLEWGATAGLGIFSIHNIIGEGFLYYSNTSLYRGISETDMPSRYYSVAGFGVKAYYESLDDYLFPMQGVMMKGKFNFAREEELSDYLYSSFRGKAEAYIPITHNLSADVGLSVGTYFDSQASQRFDFFTLGGIDEFKGYSRYEISAPHFRIMQLGFVSEPWKDVFLKAGLQGLSYSDGEFVADVFSDQSCYYAGLGIRPYRLPMRFFVALNKRNVLNTMFSIGYDGDIFHFSRK
ncbi:MAG: patatin-like phospholipase family protein [Candidatus Cloacimonetes bacterium]|jgi:predicted acylesterase/phospholipase RssA|nr:patatin-like phospholipase family protein [Candidatus Cloacimonadota bacterium]MDD4147304.1 patatin-like phospholipase family protein [Candidatus Cloacimonadota bacterium]